jgi:hypothetical protein
MRNPLCSRYDLCLSLAAHLASEFDCGHCRHANSRHRQPSEDYFSYLLLAVAVFHPKIYRQYISNRLTVKSATRKRSNKADSQERVTMKDIDRLENEVYRIYKHDLAWRLEKLVKVI